VVPAAWPDAMRAWQPVDFLTRCLASARA